MANISSSEPCIQATESCLSYIQYEAQDNFVPQPATPTHVYTHSNTAAPTFSKTVPQEESAIQSFLPSTGKDLDVLDTPWKPPSPGPTVTTTNDVQFDNAVDRELLPRFARSTIRRKT